MEFEIKNGTGEIYVANGNIGSYFYCEKPVSLEVEDLGGSVGKYLALLSETPNKKREFYQTIISSLNHDFTGKEEELSEILNPIFRLFKNGKYILNFFNGKSWVSGDAESNYNFSGYNPFGFEGEQIYGSGVVLNFPPPIELSREAEFIQASKFAVPIYQKRRLESSGWGWRYPDLSTFVGTRSYDSIDRRTVERYKNLIQEGERPFAILICSDYDLRENDDRLFVLDGHHKLIAYQELLINPPLAIIRSLNYFNFDLDEICLYLFPWQMHHIIDFLPSRDKDLLRSFNNPNSPLEKMLKNGEYKDSIGGSAFQKYMDDKIQKELEIKKRNETNEPGLVRSLRKTLDKDDTKRTFREYHRNTNNSPSFKSVFYVIIIIILAAMLLIRLV